MALGRHPLQTGDFDKLNALPDVVKHMFNDCPVPKGYGQDRPFYQRQTSYTLVCAVLGQAIRDCYEYEKLPKKDQKSLLEWLSSDERGTGFSLIDLCDYTGVDVNEAKELLNSVVQGTTKIEMYGLRIRGREH